MPAVPAIITAVATVFAAHEASSGNTTAAQTNATASDKAAQIQADTAAKVLAQAKDIYNQQRADEGPYRTSGYGALNALNTGLGLPEQNYVAPTPSLSALSTSAAPPTHVTQGGVTMPERTQPAGTPSQGTAVPRGSLAPASNQTGLVSVPTQTTTPTGGATVRIQNPATGLVHLVPATDAPALLQAGGVQV